MISYVNEDGSCDIIYNNPDASTQDEENSVCNGRIFDTLPFEGDALSTMDDPVSIKGFANMLFQIQDYATAYQFYIRAHKLIQHSKYFNVGQRLIISIPPACSGNTKSAAKKSGDPLRKQRSGKYVCVTVSDVVSESEVDVMYDEEIDGRDEEEGVHERRVLLMVSGQAAERALQGSLLMNLAKSSLKLLAGGSSVSAGWACYWACLAVAFVDGEDLVFHSIAVA